MILPSTVQGVFVGSAIIKFDETGCEAMFLSSSAAEVHKCNGNFEWTSEPFTKINGPVARIDLQLFLA